MATYVIRVAYSVSNKLKATFYGTLLVRRPGIHAIFSIVTLLVRYESEVSPFNQSQV